MVKRFLNVACIFFILIYVVPAVLLLARLCVQYADSAGNIAAGALHQTNTLILSVFSEIFYYFQREVKNCFM
jgi:hypothetical protein